MNNYNSIEEFAQTIKRGTFGLYVATITDLDMRVYPIGSKDRNMRNPYLGRVKTISVYQNAATGVNYYTIVKNECKREGIAFTNDEFSARFPKEKTYAESQSGFEGIIYVNEKSGQKYLRLYKGRKPTKVVYITLCDGEVVERGSALYNDIMRYVAPKSESKKQVELGIANVVDVRQPKLENVAYMMQGSKVYINPRHNVSRFIGDNIADLFRK